LGQTCDPTEILAATWCVAGTSGANYCRDAAFDTFAESMNHSEHRAIWRRS
jgi:hypothetical protein